MDKALCSGSVNDCGDPLLGIKCHNDSKYKSGEVPNRGSVGRVLCHGSIGDCANPLFGIKYHNDFEIKRGEVSTSCKYGDVSMPWKHRRLY